MFSQKIELTKHRFVAWFCILVAFAAYSFLISFIFIESDLQISPLFSIVILCFVTAIIFPKGFYFGVIFGLAVMFVNIMAISKVLSVAKDKMDLSYLGYFGLITLLIIISSKLGNMIHDKLNLWGWGLKY